MLCQACLIVSTRWNPLSLICLACWYNQNYCNCCTKSRNQCRCQDPNPALCHCKKAASAFPCLLKTQCGSCFDARNAKFTIGHWMLFFCYMCGYGINDAHRTLSMDRFLCKACFCAKLLEMIPFLNQELLQSIVFAYLFP